MLCLGLTSFHYCESVVVGEISYLYMKDTILKLGDMMKLACQSKFDTKHVSFTKDSLIFGFTD